MTDPKFETRAELEAWAERAARVAAWVGAVPTMLEAARTIHRVTLAHSHLIGEK